MDWNIRGKREAVLQYRAPKSHGTSLVPVADQVTENPLIKPSCLELRTGHDLAVRIDDYKVTHHHRHLGTRSEHFQELCHLVSTPNVVVISQQNEVTPGLF